MTYFLSNNFNILIFYELLKNNNLFKFKNENI